VDTTDSYNCWSYLSSMGSCITVLSLLLLWTLLTAWIDIH
jgi:hypothetical protein